MNDDAQDAAIARIEQALVRIERASESQAVRNRTLATRHTALRSRIGDAIGAIDSVIARETETD
ncbi:hypothetical protein ASE73_07165 [Sphingomonas sp. Leaf24]|uniref:hypothetical protein n=1 Tax=unclassified Sphingomonas TaxID=196159 RepID=UPI000702385C|nr:MULTISPECIES: hypothetical protein [unclassified Sphingomonas]KQM18611.1 hypothetical protein ASE50_05680 [Sphingomonas sp. Leaf5]KQM89372.1 hypothetical protein ASE73_07165 [Sphingomonas sp. Leaf24]KQM94352.1 hypothetical protein ASE70_11150 [Sphingomonas sp. Leaf22]